MKFFKWLKEEIVGHVWAILGALLLSAVCVIVFNMLLIL